MADWGYFPAVTRFAEDDTAIPNYKLALTAGASDAKGAWTQYVASAPFDVQGLWMFCQGGTNLNTELIDIGLGGAGSEQVIVPNIFLGKLGTTNYDYSPMFFPVQIPSGTRIAARGQTTEVTTDSIYIKFVMVSENGCGPFQTGTDYGTVTASSRGTQVLSSSSVNTKGSWVQLVASTGSEMIYALIMAYDDGTTSTTDFAYDIGIGGAGSEQVVIPDVFGTMWGSVGGAGGQTQGGQLVGTPLRIPSGTRIAARTAAGVASTIINISLIGFA